MWKTDKMSKKQMSKTDETGYSFRMAGESRNSITFALTHTHTHTEWKYLTLGEIMCELGWTSSFLLSLSLSLLYFPLSLRPRVAPSEELTIQTLISPLGRDKGRDS